MKTRALEARGGWFGGVNYAVSQDTINPNELMKCINARVLTSGAVQRRSGTSKTHVAALGAGGAVRGLYQWEPTAGTPQYVAIANGNLYYSANLSAWTQVVPASGTFSTTRLSDFATFREGATLYLYIATGGKVYKWDGAGVLTRVDGALSVPDATCLRSYGTRMFYNSLTNPKTLYWSKIGTGSDCTVGGLSDGGTALVDVLTGEAINAMETIGSSLLIATATSVVRFSGTSDDIQIAQDTLGVSADIGPVTDSGAAFSGSFHRVNQIGMMWTPTGPYAVTEAGVSSLGSKLPGYFDVDGAIDHLQWSPTLACHIGHHRHRNEVWFVYVNISGEQVALVYNYGLNIIAGLFVFPTPITCVATITVNGFLVLAGGGSDGFVRVLDFPDEDKDDNLTDFTYEVEPAPFIFAEGGPHNIKSVRRVFVQAEEQSDAAVAGPTVTVTPDNGTPVAFTKIDQGSTTIGAPSNRRYDGAVQGRRLVVTITGDATTAAAVDTPILHGVLLEASIMDRW
jgi:hypothetical protein